MKPLLSSLAVLALLLLTAPAFAVTETSAPSLTATGDCGVDLAQLLAAREAPVCSSKPVTIAIHCCSSTQVDLCRESCRQQGPGCKGTVGCRAGECNCTCTCP